MMTDSERLDGLLKQMRAAFDERRWDESIQIFGELNQLKLSRNMRVEANCIAARSMVNLQSRSEARKLLSSVAGMEFTKPAPYVHLAQAYLDLKNFREVARVCERIIELSEGT